MTYEDFEATLRDEAPPSLPSLVEALWWEARGNWERAHETAQDDESRNGSWVHAFLHRREGDNGNAAYWYHRAGRPVCHDGFEAERRAIVTALLPH